MSVVNDYVRSRSTEKRKPSPATINREIETLQHALRLGYDQQLITHRWSIPKHREDNVRQGFLDAADYRKLRDSIDDRAVRLMFVIAFHIGWRVGRFLGIRWDDVDLEAGIIHPPEGQAANKWVGAAPIGNGELREALVAALVDRNEYFVDCPWVVHRAGRQVRSYKNAWADATALTGMPGLRGSRPAPVGRTQHG